MVLNKPLILLSFAAFALVSSTFGYETVRRIETSHIRFNAIPEVVCTPYDPDQRAYYIVEGTKYLSVAVEAQDSVSVLEFFTEEKCTGESFVYSFPSSSERLPIEPPFIYYHPAVGELSQTEYSTFDDFPKFSYHVDLRPMQKGMWASFDVLPGEAKCDHRQNKWFHTTPSRYDEKLAYYMATFLDDDDETVQVDFFASEDGCEGEIALTLTLSNKGILDDPLGYSQESFTEWLEAFFIEKRLT